MLCQEIQLHHCHSKQLVLRCHLLRACVNDALVNFTQHEFRTTFMAGFLLHCLINGGLNRFFLWDKFTQGMIVMLHRLTLNSNIKVVRFHSDKVRIICAKKCKKCGKLGTDCQHQNCFQVLATTKVNTSPWPCLSAIKSFCPSTAVPRLKSTARSTQSFERRTSLPNLEKSKHKNDSQSHYCARQF